MIIIDYNMRRGCFEAGHHHHHPHRLGKKTKLSLSQELGGAGGWRGRGKKNLDLARKSGQEGAAVTYKSVAVMEGR